MVAVVGEELGLFFFGAQHLGVRLEVVEQRGSCALLHRGVGGGIVCSVRPGACHQRRRCLACAASIRRAACGGSTHLPAEDEEVWEEELARVAGQGGRLTKAGQVRALKQGPVVCTLEAAVAAGRRRRCRRGGGSGGGVNLASGRCCLLLLLGGLLAGSGIIIRIVLLCFVPFLRVSQLMLLCQRQLDLLLLVGRPLGDLEFAVAAGGGSAARKQEAGPPQSIAEEGAVGSPARVLLSKGLDSQIGLPRPF